MRKNEVDINKIVEKKYDIKIQDENLSFTNTSLFVLPMLNTSIVKLGKYFVNGFIKDIEYETAVDRPLFLLFNFDYKCKEEETYCKNLHNYLLEKEEFITYYYVGNIKNSKSIMYLFNIKDEFDSDYKMFLEGSYSKFRSEFKERFPKYYMDASTGKQQKTIMSQVVNKSPELRKYWSEKLGVELSEEAEVWSSPYLEKIETL